MLCTNNIKVKNSSKYIHRLQKKISTIFKRFSVTSILCHLPSLFFNQKETDQSASHSHSISFSHQDQIFDNPSTLCLAPWANNQIWLRGGLMHPTGSL